MEKVEKIVNVITNIMARLDNLEFEQQRNKETFYKVKKRLLELNDNINDILDFVDGGDMELIDEVKNKYSELRDMVDNELENNENEPNSWRILMDEFLAFLQEVRDLLLIIEEDKDLSYITRVIEKVEEEIKIIEEES